MRDLARAAEILTAVGQLHAAAPDPADLEPDLEPSRVRAAYHEAGHAVVGRTLGVEVAGIVLREDGTGVCHFVDVSGAGNEVEAAVAWAGYVGEAAAAEVSVRSAFEDWWERADDPSDDQCRVGFLSFEAPDAAAFGVVRAAEILCAESVQLDSLARGLIEHGSARPDPDDPTRWCFPG